MQRSVALARADPISGVDEERSFLNEKNSPRLAGGLPRAKTTPKHG
jgi:hypothetical protein